MWERIKDKRLRLHTLHIDLLGPPVTNEQLWFCT